MTDEELERTARGKPCMYRGPDCDGGGETTVLCHIRIGWFGMSSKPPSTCGFWGCDPCHSLFDARRVVKGYNRGELESMAFHAMLRTLHALDKEGLCP